MAWVFLYVSAILLLPFVRGDLTAALGDTVKLSSQINCGERTAELIRRLSDHSSVRMAALVNGVHQPVEEYSLRLNISSSGIFLKNVNYNDNGHYEFICGDNIERIIELRVVFISNISASEGEPRKLPCFSLTQGVDVKFVQWETNGQLVIKVDRFGKVVYGERFTDRVSLPPNWRSVGDLSLILERVQLEDQGDYYCYVQKDSKERGDPAAWRLRVRQERPSIKTFTTPSRLTQRPSAHKEPLCISLPVFFIVILVSAPFCILIGWCLGSHKSKEVKNCLGMKCWDREGRSSDQEASTNIHLID
ncbi:PREDICTED: uncharacterized protein LOC106929246 [Poecilia mexicana]|uniref:uncharacterized protein LOC106929246 n=1 Tax=Poecilia mexicana TaxID=48701 RepID=UPI00072DDB8D|nr:PREDICTED: uncharacterized protein LOC106929246 [Poecilia mexicana]